MYIQMYPTILLRGILLIDGRVDAVTFGTGTGGTLAGVGTYLKEKNHKIHVALSDPQVRYVQSDVNWWDVRYKLMDSLCIL